MQINGVIAHQRVMSSPTDNVDIHVIDNLGGANIFATTVLAQCRKNNPDTAEFVAKAFFSEFTDSQGMRHPLDNQQETTILFLNGVNSVTHVTAVINATVESLTTVWLIQETVGSHAAPYRPPTQ